VNKQQLIGRRKYFDMVHAVTSRAIAAFADEDLDFRPKPGMRSPRELVFHIYCQEQALAEAAQKATFTIEAARGVNPEDELAAPALAELITVADLKAYAERCHRAANAIFEAMSEEDVARPVESPFGKYPASQYHNFAYDEHWHHRGQLYVYLRLLGKEPPGLYDY
jgi:uncharacterized damage-inducible protein DinB